MRPNRLTTKRRAPKQTAWKTFHAAVKRKKQRAATIATRPNMEMESDVPNLNISRALVVLLLFHVIAIGGMYAHSKWFAETNQPAVVEENPDAPAADIKPEDIPAINNTPLVPQRNFGHEPYVVHSRDTYGSIAAANDVDEFELRRLNNNSELRSGKILRLPAKMVKPTPSRVVATAVAAPTPAPAPMSIDDIETIEVIEAPAPPKAVVVNEAVASNRTHKVSKGDTVWRISNKFKVDQKALMSLNGISDPSRLKIGQVLRIPG